jgi:Tfp pilus assembly protein PilN
MKRHTRSAAAALLLCLSAATGCAMTPDEIAAVKTENELLREQIAALRERCQQGRELELRREVPVDEHH